MARRTTLTLLALLPGLCGCAPDQVSHQVGRSLYDASVGTGRALATAGDRTGAAIERVGASLRPGSGPPPPPPPLQLPPPYVPDGFGPVTAPPLGPPRGDPG